MASKVDGGHLNKGIRQLADLPPTSTESRLIVFADYFGVDGYEPPEDVAHNVRELVKAFLLDVRAARLAKAASS